MLTPIQNKAPFGQWGNLAIKQTRYGPMMYLINDQFVGRSLDQYGEFSPGEARLFGAFIRPGMRVIDGGANIGCHTILFAQLVGAYGKVIAYEPQPAIYHLLCGNIALNSIHHRVVAIPVALGSKDQVDIAVPELPLDEGGNFGGYPLGEGFFKVPVEVLDSLTSLGERIDFIKLDLEGMEIEALRGAQQLITRDCPILYVENDREEKATELNSLIMSLGYDLYWHFTPLYERKNYFDNSRNMWPHIYSLNVLGIHNTRRDQMSEAKITDFGLKRITDVFAPVPWPQVKQIDRDPGKRR